MDYDEKEKLSAFSQEEKAVAEALLSLSLHTEEEKYWVAEWLIRHGGNFERGIGVALAHADVANTQKIKEAWGDPWGKALSFTKERRENNDFY